MKIAIQTYINARNYGSVLQAYALNAFLRMQGHDVETIDYTSDSQRYIYKFFEPYTSLRSVIKNIYTTRFIRQCIRQKKRFEKFIKKHIPLTKDKFNGSGLEVLADKYDYFICGSDQIWNNLCADYDSNYMLSYVYNKQKCIAYAPSLGNSIYNQDLSDNLRSYVCEFKALSSRESSGVDFISEVTNRNVTLVCDPVFLLSQEEWNCILPETNIANKKYILGYFIGDVEGMREFASKMAKEQKLPVIVIYKNIRDVKFRVRHKYDSGPLEFINLIKNAHCIVTNSFHAVSFSLIFRKNFWVFVNQISRDERISNILHLVDLTHRIKTSSTISNEAIDYKNVNFDNINELISKSKQFLTDNLK